jgi:hypothetical protein
MANVTSSISPSDTPEKFMKALEDFDKTTWKNVNFLIKAVTAQLFEDVIRDTPFRTGRAKNNWVFSAGTKVYKNVGPKKLTKKQIATGASPFDKTGETAIKAMQNGLRREHVMTKGKKFVLEYYLTNQVPYIHLLEYGGYPGAPGPNTTGDGHSTQAPGGMADKNIQKYAHMSLTHISKMKGKL